MTVTDGVSVCVCDRDSLPPVRSRLQSGRKEEKRKKKGVDSSETGELRHCSPSFSWLTASCCPNCSGGDTLATAAVAADSLIGRTSHQNNSKSGYWNIHRDRLPCLLPGGDLIVNPSSERRRGYVAAMGGHYDWYGRLSDR